MFMGIPQFLKNVDRTMSLGGIMEQIQSEIEQQYSRKSIRARVEADIETEQDVFTDVVNAIDKYRAGSYYASKQARIHGILGMNSHDLALEIFICVLPIREISPIQAVATKLGAQLKPLSLLDGVKTAAELLAVGELSGAYTIYHSNCPENGTGTMGIRSNYHLDSDTQAFVDQTQYLPPMLCKPVPWDNNMNGGHLQGSSSVLLGHLNHHDENQALDVINILQDISWSLNEMVDYVEKPNKPLDTHDKAQQFHVLQEDSFKVYDELMHNGNAFHFVWKFDKRGRMYSQGYHCNLQSTEYKKAILNFTKEELIQ